MSKLITIWRALQLGKQIDHPSKWKNVQNTTNALVAILSFVIMLLKIMGFDLPMTDEEIVVVAGGIAAVLGVANSVITVITTKKISITGESLPEENSK